MFDTMKKKNKTGNRTAIWPSNPTAGHTHSGIAGGMIWENSIETCILPYVKQITSPGSMHESGCSGLVH